MNCSNSAFVPSSSFGAAVSRPLRVYEFPNCRRLDNPTQVSYLVYLQRSDPPLRVSGTSNSGRSMQLQRVKETANCGRWERPLYLAAVAKSTRCDTSPSVQETAKSRRGNRPLHLAEASFCGRLMWRTRRSDLKYGTRKKLIFLVPKWFVTAKHPASRCFWM